MPKELNRSNLNAMVNPKGATEESLREVWEKLEGSGALDRVKYKKIVNRPTKTTAGSDISDPVEVFNFPVDKVTTHETQKLETIDKDRSLGVNHISDKWEEYIDFESYKNNPDRERRSLTLNGVVVFKDFLTSEQGKTLHILGHAINLYIPEEFLLICLGYSPGAIPGLVQKRKVYHIARNLQKKMKDKVNAVGNNTTCFIKYSSEKRVIGIDRPSK